MDRKTKAIALKRIDATKAEVARKHDREELAAERDRRWDAGETTAAIDLDFVARGINPTTLASRPMAKQNRPTAAVLWAVARSPKGGLMVARDTDGTPKEANSGEDWASGPVTPLSREILEDRWAGLLRRQDATKLQLQLDKVLRRLAEDLTRRDVYSESAVIDGDVVSLDFVMDIDGLQAVIRDWMLERAAKVAVR